MISKFFKLGLIILLLVLGFGGGWLWRGELSSFPISKIEKTMSDEDFQKLLQKLPENFQKNNTPRLICKPETKIICNGDQCEKSDSDVYLVIDEKNKTFSRCGEENCDTYNASFKTAGSFTNIQSIEPMGLIIKIMENNKYIEVATLHLTSFISKGECSIKEDLSI